MTDTPRTPYEALGDAGIRKLVDRFYDLMDTLPEARAIRAMHAGELAPMRDKLHVFMVGWMGGPSNYGARFGPINVPAVHAPYAIGPAERDAWMLCMRLALDEAELTPTLRPRVDALLAQMAEMCRTREADGSVRAQFRGP
jgi:hemoglobin